MPHKRNNAKKQYTQPTNSDVLQAIQGLATYMKKGFSDMDKRFSQHDELFDAIKGEFNSIDQRFERIDQRFDRLEERVLKIESTMVTKDYLDKKLAELTDS